jgi:hypothetical protein
MLALVTLAGIAAGCGSGTTLLATSLRPVKLLTIASEYSYFGGSPCPDHGSGAFQRPASADQALVGKDIATRSIPYSATNGFEQCQTIWLFYAAAVVFDVARLDPARIGRATLSLQLLGARASCATRLDLADDAVASPSDTLSSERYTVLPRPGPGGMMSVDVTSAVKAWAGHSRPNDGFALLGPTLDDGNAPACVSAYGDVALLVAP